MWILNDRFIVDEASPPRCGGMAEVHKAIDAKSNGQQVAVKLFREGFISDELVLEAFSRETSALVELNNHSNIVKLIDWGTDEKKTNRRFLILQWLENNLSDALSAGELAGWDEFYDSYGQKILSALNYAYARDVLHRDVKPSNIMVDLSGIPYITDFGISKFKRYYKPGPTLLQFKSVPYQPRIDADEYPGARDVYSFAILCIECIFGKVLKDYESLSSTLDAIDVPPDVYGLLQKCISESPDERPADVSELFEAFEEIARRRSKGSEAHQVYFIKITQNALNNLLADLNETSAHRVQRRVVDELNEACAIARWQSPGVTPGARDSEQYVLFGVDYRYQTVVDEKARDHLVIVNAFRSSPGQLERLRERNWRPAAHFQLLPPFAPTGAANSIQELIFCLEEHEALVRRDANAAMEVRIFDKWASMLRLKLDLEDQRQSPLEYNDFSISGQRIKFKITEVPDEDIYNQQRYIRLNETRLIVGEVESFKNGWLTMFVEEFDPEEIPRRASIVFDTRRSEQAIARQNQSLDAVRYDRAVRSGLKEMIIHPETVSAPRSQFTIPYFFQDLDDDKKKAVHTCLNADDIVVVDGPPGTGKTQFITEIILQTLKREPKTRILLSAQTHNALDNVIERLERTSDQDIDTPRIVRIGRRSDERISEKVKPYLLEHQVTQWLEDVAARSDDFLSKWASQHGISKEFIMAGIAIARLRSAKAARVRLASDVERIASEMAALIEEEEESRAKANTGERLLDIREELEHKRREYADFRADLKLAVEELKEAELGVAAHAELGSDFVDLNVEDLLSWERDFIAHHEDGPKLKRLVDISEEWRERFGRSSDFFAAYVSGAQLIAGTCVGFATRALQDISFDLCIIDEASKATPTEVLVPMARARRWVIVGDPRQLPPYVDEAIRNARLLEEYDLSPEDAKATLLDHLLERIPEYARVPLRQQHRMVRPIGDLVSQCFYDGELVSVRTEIDPNLSKLHAIPTPVSWFSTSKSRARAETPSGSSFKNFVECKAIDTLLHRLEFTAKKCRSSYSVAVLAGYAAQVEELRSRLARFRVNEHLMLEICSVDAFQGRDADIAVYSITRSNDEGEIGFLRERERLNVALSRGREALCIVGDHVFCEKVVGENPFSDVLRYMRQHPGECSITEVQT